MWLPKFLYESIPFYYIGFGTAALGAAFFVEAWVWAEILAGAGVLSLIIGLVLLLRRKGYRSSRSRMDFDESS